jgi:hypothetical protein
MSTRRRIEALEAEALRQGYADVDRRMGERISKLSSAELASIQAQLEHYCRTGEASPGLIETIKELTAP